MCKIAIIVVTILFLFLGCSNDTYKNSYEWVSLDKNKSWGTELKSCAKQGFKLPRKEDFLSKLQENPDFFDNDTLYKVTPTTWDKITDNEQLSFEQSNYKNDDNHIYFDIESKKLIHYSVKLQDNDNITLKTYCIKMR